MIGLVWNGMMSFGGGWFFLAASEAIAVLGHNHGHDGQTHLLQVAGLGGLGHIGADAGQVVSW
jgi:NitT/TauT family transport system permease protein